MNIVVLDIGRSHVKLCLIDAKGRIQQRTETDNSIRTFAGVDVFNTQNIWRWFLDGLSKICLEVEIDAIVTTTHGASVALLDKDGDIILDVTSYESEQYQCSSTGYKQARDEFKLTGSPYLDNGLNLGKQLYWLETTLASEFKKVSKILTYPQYWGYLLTGNAATEISSLGAHTDLWFADKGRYSNLVKSRNWESLFPPVRNAWDSLGMPLAEIVNETGLNPDCRILCGVHDSNAAFAYHYEAGQDMTLLSTGTWVIGMCTQEERIELDEDKDELLNINVMGKLVPSFRFMGGREWEVLTTQYSSEELPVSSNSEPTLSDLLTILKNGIMALPAFSDQGGAFRHQQGRLIGKCESLPQQKALASLYCAQMTAWSIERFHISGKLIVDGPFINDPIFLRCLAALLPSCEITVSKISDGTALGAARMAIWPERFVPEYEFIPPQDIEGLSKYHKSWCAQTSR